MKNLFRKGGRHSQIIESPDMPGGISENHADSNGNHDGVEMGSVDEAPERQAFDDHPDKPGNDEAKDKEHIT